MKLITAFLITGFQFGAFAQGEVLKQGQSYIFEFTSLPYMRPATQIDSGSFNVRFATGTFTDTDSVLLELFPQSLSDTPLSSTFSGSGGPLDAVEIGQAWTAFSPPFWPDLQGIARVTMLTGDAQISILRVQQIVDGGVYSQTFAVPEPSVSILSFYGATIVLLFGRRRTRLPNTALEATPHSHCGFASELSGCLMRWVRGASAFVR